MVGKIKIFKNMHGDTMNNSDELTHKKDEISVVLSYARRKPNGLVLT